MDLLLAFNFSIGLAILLLSGYWLIPAAVSFATHIKLPARFIASIVIAGGTSAPELLVSLDAGFTGNPDIAWGNIVGSNIANIFLVGGIGMLILPININNAQDRKDASLLLALTLITGIILFLDWDSGGERFWAAAFLISMFVFYSRSHTQNTPEQQPQKPSERQGDEVSAEAPQFGLPLSACITIITIVGLVLGADYMVQAAVLMADDFGIEQAVIGVTIVAIGTSLPEITAVAASLLNKRSDMAIGNIIGSNMFNIAIVLGITLIVTPLPASPALIGPAFGFFLTSIGLLAWLIFSQKKLGFKTGISFVGLYGLFILAEITL